MSRVYWLSYLLVYLFTSAIVAQSPTPAPGAGQPVKPPVIPDVEKAGEMFRAGKFKEALELLEKAGKANPQLAPAKLTMANWFVQANRGSDARLMLEQAAAADPRHPEIFLQNASYAFGEGRLTDAILSCQFALLCADDKRWDPEQRKRYQRDSRLGLASSFETRGDFAAAKEAILALLNEDAKNGALRQRLAGAVFQLGKTEEAFAELTKAHADDPTVDPAELRMAALWSNKGDRDQAEEWLKKAVSAHAKNPKTHRAYASFLLDESKPDAASLYLDSATKLDPTGRDTLALKALLHRQKKEFLQAESLFEQLYRDGPSDGFAIANLAIVLAESADEKKRKRAIDLADSLVKQNNRSGEAFAVLGWCLYKNGRLDDADKALSTSASTGQIAYDTAYYLARLLNDRMKYEEAHKLLKDVVSGRGPFVYRAEAKVLFEELAKKVPEKKEEPKK